MKGFHFYLLHHAMKDFEYSILIILPNTSALICFYSLVAKIQKGLQNDGNKVINACQSVLKFIEAALMKK